MGGWIVEDIVSAGGFGTVYRARHEVLGRTAAIKVLHADLSGSREVRQRFELEARAANMLGHPAALDIYDFGELEDARPYFVMELLEGTDLLAYLDAHGRMSVPETLEVLGPLCEVLALAHARSLVHRDIKASNVFLCREPKGRVVLLDFGVAKLLEGVGTGLTTSHGLVGTPSFMSPEQILGAPVDARTDVYALGVLTFHMLAGQPPYGEASAATMHHLHLHAGRPRPSTRAPVAPEVDAVVVRAMAREPEHRFPSAPALLEAFRAAASRLPQALPTRARGLAIHVDLALAQGALESSDDALLGAIEGVIPALAQLLEPHGFTLELETGMMGLFVLLLPLDPAGDLAARQEAAGLAHKVLERARAAHPTIRARVAVHVDEVLLVGHRPRGGELLRVQAWLARLGTDDLVLSDAVTG